MIRSRVFNTTPGASALVHFSLSGKHIHWVKRSGMTYKETQSFTVGNQEFRKTGIAITFEQPFNLNEKVWVLYT